MVRTYKPKNPLLKGAKITTDQMRLIWSGYFLPPSTAETAEIAQVSERTVREIFAQTNTRIISEEPLRTALLKHLSPELDFMREALANEDISMTSNFWQRMSDCYARCPAEIQPTEYISYAELSRVRKYKPIHIRSFSRSKGVTSIRGRCSSCPIQAFRKRVDIVFLLHIGLFNRHANLGTPKGVRDNFLRWAFCGGVGMRVTRGRKGPHQNFSKHMYNLHRRHVAQPLVHILDQYYRLHPI
ncbi:hypothetical protein [Jiella pacifica]|uniref:Uncharacterized protein n=1 Tax=Jiella pacifica TaxID=2696469 RepID=A0A6N9T1A9_9HYPH|nr:hypothetical protein [Jiella pacifica]NDW05114.1 hypothetical protein [Jiella pacifica]